MKHFGNSLSYEEIIEDLKRIQNKKIEFIATKGMHVAKIWFVPEKNIWKWSFSYTDGSGHKTDWHSSYIKCKQELSLYIGDVRFKKVN